jgi:F-type H+-transporting ATPase subunit a
MPYVFTTTAHLVVSLRIASTIWISIILYGWINKTNKILIHIVPIGTPTILIPFIVLIELISNIIRPISLAVRLTANIIAGHLLIRLLGNNLISNFPLLLITIWLFLILIVFELAVAFIQSYVFTTLSNLYYREV